MYLFIDTETTGFVNKSLPPKDPKQARIVQLGMILTDENGVDKSRMSFLIQPDGWQISEGAQKIHGISIEECQKFGIPSKHAMSNFMALLQVTDTVIAHNMAFDAKMLEIELACHDVEIPKFKTHCTMLHNTHISGGKWPKLGIAYKHFTGKEMSEDAHDALVDAQACKEVFFASKAKAA